MSKMIDYVDFELNNYLNDLKVIGSLSKLFSDNKIPFLHYRVAENTYCSSFEADNISRHDVSVDAKYKKPESKSFGVGIKTFIESNKATFQKIAEFNKQIHLYKDLKVKEKIVKIAELRNKRLIVTKNIHDVEKLIYHCVIRNEQGFYLFEEEIHLIDIAKIEIINSKNGTILFTDGICEYQFYESKSTLFKRFKTNEYFAEIDVQIIEDPIKELQSLNIHAFDSKPKYSEYIVLPLFVFKNHTNEKIVAEKSGLNQWNAIGRKDKKGIYHKRNYNEVYIPYPIDIRDHYENFFPNRNTPFNVSLPNGETISFKVCQQGGKAIMSNPNKALGKWLLRDVLKLPEGKIVTYQDLLEAGIDAVRFEKYGDSYKLNFVEIGVYDDFIANTFNDVNV